METNSSVYNKAKLLIDLKQDFILTLSNYTTKVEIGEIKHTGAAQRRSNAFFGLSNKLKKEVLSSPELDYIKNHSLQKWEQNYFYSLVFNAPIYSDEIFAVDITNAYPSVLKNSGLISESLFKEMNKYSKADKLGALGSLASKKEIITFEKGKPINTEVEEKETAFIFNYCVKYVDKLIYKAMEFTELDSFLFYWFDCLYFIEKPKELNIIKELFKVNGLELHEKQIVDFEMFKNKKEMKIEFKEFSNKKGVFERKIFNIPLKLSNQEIKTLNKKLN